MVAAFKKRLWVLTTRLSGNGQVSIDGVETEDEVIFPHPKDLDEIVLRVSVRRAFEISRWSFHRAIKMNMRVQVFEDAQETSERCQCGQLIVFFKVGETLDVIHSIPYCEDYKRAGLKLYLGRYK